MHTIEESHQMTTKDHVVFVMYRGITFPQYNSYWEVCTVLDSGEILVMIVIFSRIYRAQHIMSLIRNYVP